MPACLMTRRGELGLLPTCLGGQTNAYNTDACVQDIRGAGSKGLGVKDIVLQEVNPGRWVGVVTRQKWPWPSAGMVCANVKGLDAGWTHTWVGVHVGVVVRDGAGGEGWAPKLAEPIVPHQEIPLYTWTGGEPFKGLKQESDIRFWFQKDCLGCNMRTGWSRAGVYFWECLLLTQVHNDECLNWGNGEDRREWI